jgi:virginiamycin A acetyltransferase
MTRPFPAADTRNPLILPDGTRFPGTVFLKPALSHPRIEVGEYSYASADAPPQNWARRLAPYLFDFSPERLVIGRFCQIAHGAVFVTASANHRRDGFSTYPFAVFDGGFDDLRPSLPGPGPDTVIGNDVWIGREAMILPGARIGDGVIVGARAVVGGTVPPYSVVGGNPGRVLRGRFDDATIARLLALRWWDWPIERVLANEAAICGGDVGLLSAG